MKNPNSPFRLMLRVAFYGVLISTALAAYLFSTSKTDAQIILTFVVYVLCIMLSLAVGFYVALRFHVKREAKRNAEIRRAIHYPATDKINVYMRGRHG